MSDLAPVYLVVYDLYSGVDPQAAGLVESDAFQENWFQQGDISANLLYKSLASCLATFGTASITTWLQWTTLQIPMTYIIKTTARLIMSLSPFGQSSVHFKLSVYYVLDIVFDTQKTVNVNKSKD